MGKTFQMDMLLSKMLQWAKLDRRTYYLQPKLLFQHLRQLLHHRLVVDVIQIIIKIALLVVRHMHLATIYGYPMVLKIIALPYGETVPERLVVDLLNVLAMVTLLHVFHLRMLHLLQLLHQLRLAVQRGSLAKVKKIAVKRSARRENARSKIICILFIIMCITVFIRLIVAFCIWSVTCAYPYSYKILLL